MVTRRVLVRFYLSMARCLWEAAIRWPLNPTGARTFGLLFLIGWRARGDSGMRNAESPRRTDL